MHELKNFSLGFLEIFMYMCMETGFKYMYMHVFCRLSVIYSGKMKYEITWYFYKCFYTS